VVVAGSEILLLDKLAEIIGDALGARGLDSYGAATKIIELPEVKDAFAALDREDSWSSIYDGDG
jgi:hypothetical protein